MEDQIAVYGYLTVLTWPTVQTIVNDHADEYFGDWPVCELFQE
jgi:hypothetical protein